MADEEMKRAAGTSRRCCRNAIDAAQGWELERKLEIAADALRCHRGRRASPRSRAGSGRRVALCRLLRRRRTCCMLDEPTNHLDAESIAWLERYLEEYPSTVIAVTHDRYFLDIRRAMESWKLDRG